MFYERRELMESIRDYLLGITAAALVCGTVTALAGKKGTIGAIIKAMCGVFMTLTVVNPWTSLRLDPVSGFSDSILREAEELGAEGENMSREALADGIKTAAETYILDKADALGVSLSVEVTVTDTQPPVPGKVLLQGAVSPYAKQELTRIITEDLAIAREDQIWT